MYFYDFLNHVTYNIRVFYHIEFIWRYDCESELPKIVSMVKILQHPVYASPPLLKKYFY